ncbi:fungal-specific transcription factor domain-containing protein [Xylogone sp. PMI_703]|nr:fungal-specific transcription factor domain-containing protein [Xylogone sp. PMI_703]
MNRKRGRTGCLTCRARKIKCDESVGICNNCSRVNVECVQSSNESLPQSARFELATHAQQSQRFTQAGLERRRIKRSCITCKLVKKRCGGERPRCARCLQRGLDCVYTEELEREAVPKSAAVAIPIDGVLTNKTVVRELCNAFFEEISPLRCFGFLHRPTFIQHVEDNFESNDPLLISICALATKTIQKRELWDIGCEWAQDAQKLLFERIDDISVRMLMCIVLLHEHSARIGQLRLCFMLSSMASRYTQALSLNLEHDHDILCINSLMSPVEKESRRRLMWACYILDTLQACGLNHLQMLHTSNIRIQLPCEDRKFLYKVACHTATVPASSGSLENRGAKMPSENQGLQAFSVRLYLIREQLLQYINSHTDEEDPWRITSLLADLEHWKDALPPDLIFNSDVVAIRKEESLLSALVSLHILYHQVNCLAYRCTIPSMWFPARAQTRLSMKASADFLSESRRGWFDHACAMTTIFEVALEHRPVSMTDPAVATSAYNAIVIKWLYLTNFVPPEERLLKMEEILPLVNIDLQFLEELHGFHPPSVHTTYSAAKRLVDEAKILLVQNPTITLSESDHLNLDLGFPTDCISPDYNTNPLSTFSQMRKELRDRHAPDWGGIPMDNEESLVNRTEGLWVWK